MHETVIGGCAAIHAQLREMSVGVGFDSVHKIGDLVRDTFQGCARDMTSVAAPRQAEDCAAGVRIPVRSTKAHEGRDEVHPTIVGDIVRQGFHFR